MISNVSNRWPTVPFCSQFLPAWFHFDFQQREAGSIGQYQFGFKNKIEIIDMNP